MKKTIQIIKKLEEEGIINGYALGGATALLFYAEPALTFDIDIFIFLPDASLNKGLINLENLYSALELKNYHAEKEHVYIEGVPVQFIPVYNNLIEEAVKQAVPMMYEGLEVKVVTLEHLLAIMIDTNRPKDRERIGKLLDETDFNKSTLESILKRHALLDKWEKLVGKKQNNRSFF